MPWLSKKNCKVSPSNRDRGFTLIEVLVVMLLVGILSAIAAPGWLGFVNNQRLNTAQSRVFSTLKDAQSSAKRVALRLLLPLRVIQLTEFTCRLASRSRNI
jgi:prepilin-type N-terminal cleavage/methylation domain-containing protein